MFNCGPGSCPLLRMTYLDWPSGALTSHVRLISKKTWAQRESGTDAKRHTAKNGLYKNIVELSENAPNKIQTKRQAESNQKRYQEDEVEGIKWWLSVAYPMAKTEKKVSSPFCRNRHEPLSKTSSHSLPKQDPEKVPDYGKRNQAKESWRIRKRRIGPWLAVGCKG